MTNLVKVDIGCGRNKKEGYIGVDLIANDGVDYVINIEKEPLPFNNNSVDEIVCLHTLEHLNDIQFTMTEIYRVLKVNGLIEIRVPYYKHPVSISPFHKLNFGYTSFDYYCKESARMDLHGNIKFKELKKEVIFVGGILTQTIGKYANRNYYLYDKIFSQICPAKSILWILKKC